MKAWKNFMIATASLVFIVGAGAWSIDKFIERYHETHRRKHASRLLLLQKSKPTRSAVKRSLGDPYQVVNRSQAIRFAAIYKDKEGEDDVKRAAKKYPYAIFIYLVDSMVYFIFFDTAGEMVDFSVIRN